MWLLSRLKGAEEEHRQGNKMPTSLHGRAATARAENPPCCSKHVWEKRKAAESPAFPECFPMHGASTGTDVAWHGPAVPPATGVPPPALLCATVVSGWLWALHLANKRHSLGNHCKLHPPNLTPLHKPSCSHVKVRAARERASCFGESRAHAVSGQKSKAHMERKGKSIHHFRLFTVCSGATRCPRRAEGGMAEGRGSPSAATRPPLMGGMERV